MTEKRFITNDPYGYSKIFYDGSRLDNKKVCKKLNALNEENEQLKSENQRLEKIIEELNYELTELKQSNDDNYNITDGLW